MEDELGEEMPFFDTLDNLTMDEQDPLVDSFTLGETLFSQSRHREMIASAPDTPQGVFGSPAVERKAIWRQLKREL